MAKIKLDELKEMLEKISGQIGERMTGSAANQKLTEYAADYFQKRGYEVERQEFSCIDWQTEGAEIFCGGRTLPAEPSYYTPGCQVEGEPVWLSTLVELMDAELAGKIAVLTGELTEEQLMPKSFTFYNPERHQKIIRLLEEKEPTAIITVVKNDTSVFEDGDFAIPSVYVSPEVGDKLSACEGKIKLSIRAEQLDSTGANVIARINAASQRKMVITAHLDTKYGTPGALDNATGIAALLLLSRLIQPEMIDYCLELLLLNGEDYYSTPGQMKYMAEYLGDDNNVMLAVNCDGIGLKDSKTAVAGMELTEDKAALVESLVEERADFTLVEPWMQGDHMIFAMNQIPVVAMTSKDIFRMIDNIIHTEQDTLDLVDYDELGEVISFLEDLIKSY